MTDRRYTGPERRSSWWYRWQLAGPYVAIAVVIIIGFFVQGQNSDRIEREAIERDVAICEDGNRRSAGVVGFVERLVDELPLPDQVGSVLVALAGESFQQQDCAALRSGRS